jgi:hypothetical protein
MTKPYASVDASMLFAIGPERTLFETSLHKAHAAVMETPERTGEYVGAVAELTKF